MSEPVSDEIDESDVTTAVESLNSASFKKRSIRTDRNAADPEWKAPSGEAISDHVRDQMDAFKKDVDVVRLHHFHGGVFHKFDADAMLTIAHHHLLEPVVPTARDLFHVYGPDRDNLRDWKRYYRYAWKDASLNALVYSDRSSEKGNSRAVRMLIPARALMCSSAPACPSAVRGCQSQHPTVRAVAHERQLHRYAGRARIGRCIPRHLRSELGWKR